MSYQQPPYQNEDFFFDPTGVQELPKVQPGLNVGRIIGAEKKAGRNYGSEYIEITVEIAGLTIKDRITIANQSEKAVQMGLSRLKQVYRCAFGGDKAAPISMLKGRPVKVNLVQKPSELNGNMYLEIDEWVVSAQTQTQPPQQTQRLQQNIRQQAAHQQQQQMPQQQLRNQMSQQQMSQQQMLQQPPQEDVPF